MSADYFTRDGIRLAYRALPGVSPTVVYLTGFKSSMKGRKARRVEAVCRAGGLACLRFDHRGHGASAGALVDGSIGIWYRDALSLLRARVRGELILIGASMGVWLMLLLARAFAEDRERVVRGMIGLGGVADRVYSESGLTRCEAEALRCHGLMWRPSRYEDGSYPLTARMVEDGHRFRVLEERWNPRCPVQLIHGMQDPDVSWRESISIADSLGGRSVRVDLVSDGDHRLSRVRDLERLEKALDRVVSGVRSGSGPSPTSGLRA